MGGDRGIVSHTFMQTKIKTRNLNFIGRLAGRPVDFSYHARFRFLVQCHSTAGHNILLRGLMAAVWSSTNTRLSYKLTSTGTWDCHQSKYFTISTAATVPGYGYPVPGTGYCTVSCELKYIKL